VVSLPHLGVDVASDAGAAGEWETTAGGKVLAVSVRESFTGRGAKVLVIDDPHKDFIDAHSALSRQTIWDWWLSVAQLRLEPPYLVIVVMTRWHEDDLVGRLLSPEHEGDPSGWEVIRLPAVADHETGLDAIGREPGEPLLSPLIEEDVHAASARWAEVRSSVGSYVWASLMQQRPAPSKGAIFDTSWWRFWTRDPAKATPDGRVILLDPYTDPMVSRGGRWIESWDCAFKGTDDSDFVVGQRWVRHGTRRILVAQRRDRLTFTATLAAMNDWADDPLASLLVYERLVEDKANGTAIIDTLQASVDGLIPINPTTSKEARARSVTPEVESGNVYLPHPLDPGNEWVGDYLTEMRDFPHGSHDDQVDATSQALTRLRDVGTGALVVPGSVARPPTSPPRRRAQVAAAGGIRRGYR
jgi:predicted phage terminase large subunit-like protein